MEVLSDLNNLQLKIQMTIPNVPHDFENRFKATSGHLLMVWAILAGIHSGIFTDWKYPAAQSVERYQGVI